MKLTRLILCSTIASLIFTVRVSGQTVAVGHIYAEVVESVSAASLAYKDFSLSDSDLTHASGGELNAEKIRLGTIKLNTGQNIACDFTIIPGLLTDNAGNRITLEPSLSPSYEVYNETVSGIQNLEISGRARLGAKQENGLYQGTYTVVFNFN